MGLEEMWLKRLQEAVIRGAYLHDIGKANSQFQRLVARKSRNPQAFRHELISLLLALKWKPLVGFKDSNGEREVVYASLFAALGHHLKFDSLELYPREGSGDTSLIIYTGHADVKELLERGAALFGLPIPHPFTQSVTDDLKDLKVDLFGDPMKDVREWVKESIKWWEGINNEVKRFVGLVKALVIGADLISSVAVRHGDAQSWADSVLGRVCNRDELIQVAHQALDGNPVRAFQDRVAHSTSRVSFVHAGCGTGKTIAAYLWAANNASNRKVFFCYPTTGTATQGYLDYVADENIISSGLIHSRSEVDLEMLLESSGDETDHLDAAFRYEALSGWDYPLVVATVDTVLGLMQDNRRGLFLFPSIGEGAFVFDEIHYYDKRLFGALLRFLNTFLGSKVLLMTASLQQDRLKDISGVLAQHGETIEVIDGPAELEEVKRYIINPITNDPPWEKVRKALDEGKKVLWVANTVERARQIWRDASTRLSDTPLLLYHGRYRYLDRVEHHNRVIDAFNSGNNKRSVLAITTQVCEISLNISAEMLVTDLAPVPALIQRMGRVNRVAIKGSPKPVYIMKVESPEPYLKEEIDAAGSWLNGLLEEMGESISQADLAKKFESYGSGTPSNELESSWLDGGPFSRPLPLREEGYTVSVIRNEDMQRYMAGGGRVANSEVIKYSIPMPLWPVKDEIYGWRRLNGALVAPTGRIEYSEKEGGSWR
jgi:CRISPR-associated endonuclease/helicase Cas3